MFSLSHNSFYFSHIFIFHLHLMIDAIHEIKVASKCMRTSEQQSHAKQKNGKSSVANLKSISAYYS